MSAKPYKCEQQNDGGEGVVGGEGGRIFDICLHKSEVNIWFTLGWVNEGKSGAGETVNYIQSKAWGLGVVGYDLSGWLRGGE